MTDQELTVLNNRINKLEAENKRITDENNSLKSLINDHARRIDINARTIKNFDKTFRGELNRIASAFKRVQNLIKRQ